MDKTPDSSSGRRSMKRPHSPQEEKTVPVEPKVSSADSEGGILDSESKRDKLMRLLGGKKRKNETAASKWLDRVRSREDELKVSTDLESQFNESLTNKLTGQSRRHVGIGYHEEVTAPQVVNKPENVTSDSSNNNVKDSKTDSKDSSSAVNVKGGSPSILDSLSKPANVPGFHKTRNFEANDSKNYNPVNFAGYSRFTRPHHGLGHTPQPPGRMAPQGGTRFIPPPQMPEFMRPPGGTGYAPPPFSNRFPPPQYGYSHNTNPQRQNFVGPNVGGQMAPSHGMGFVKSSESDKKTNQDHASQEKPSTVPKTKNAFYAQFKKAS